MRKIVEKVIGKKRMVMKDAWDENWRVFEREERRLRLFFCWMTTMKWVRDDQLLRICCQPSKDAGSVRSLGWLLTGSSRASLLADQRLVDMRDDSSTSDGSLDQGIQFLVSSDGQLQMSRGDSLHLQIFGCISGQLEHLSGQVLQNSG